MSEQISSLKFSIKANWVPLYINGKLVAGRVVPLHSMDERLFDAIDDRGQKNLQEYYYSRYGRHCKPEDCRLNGTDFLKKNNFVSNAILITYDRVALLLGYSVFTNRSTESNPQRTVYVDYFTSLPLNYPDNIKPHSLGQFLNEDTYYRVRGIGRASVSMACCYALNLRPKEKPGAIAVELTARPDDMLVNDIYVKKYGLEFQKGARGAENDLFFTFKKARKFLNDYESSYKTLERPEANGLTFNNPLRY